MNKILLLVIVVNVLTSCLSDENIDKRDFSIYVSDVNIHMTTSKRKGGVFYVMFDNKKQTTQLSDSIDYIKVRTGGEITIMFDTLHKDKIHIYSQFRPDSVNQVKYSYDFIDEWAWERGKEFYNSSNNNIENGNLKPQYRRIYIETKYYKIKLNEKVLKKGNVLGGWREN